MNFNFRSFRLCTAFLFSLHRSYVNNSWFFSAARNGVYVNVVDRVKEAFMTEEVVRLDCTHVGTSDCKRIGAKLRVWLAIEINFEFSLWVSSPFLCFLFCVYSMYSGPCTLHPSFVQRRADYTVEGKTRSRTRLQVH